MPPPVPTYVGPGSDPVTPPDVHPDAPSPFQFVPFSASWWEQFFPHPQPPQPMRKGEPQTPASESQVGGLGVGKGGLLTKQQGRDLIVYGGAAILLIIAVAAALK